MWFFKVSRSLSCGMVWLVILVCVPATLRAEAVRTPGVVRGIQYLTADSTLLPIIRRHGLVTAFGTSDEAAALAEFRGMIDITESPDGKFLEVGVLSGNSSRDVLLTNALADTGRGVPTRETESVTPVTDTEMQAQGEIVRQKRQELQRIMDERGIPGGDLLSYENLGEVEETLVDADLRAKWVDVTDRMKLFQSEMVKVVQEGNAKREAEALKMAVIEAEGTTAKISPVTDAALSPDYLRARRAWEQQLAVRNHFMFRQYEASVLKSREVLLVTTDRAVSAGAFYAPTIYRVSARAPIPDFSEHGRFAFPNPNDRQAERDPWQFLLFLLLVIVLVLVFVFRRRERLNGK